MAGLKEYGQMHFIIFIWGFTAILGLLITIPSVEIVFYRTAIASAALGIMLKVQGKPLDLGMNRIIRYMITGVIIAAHWILFFGSARVSTASVCLAGMATCSLWTSFLEPLIMKRRVKPHEVFLGLVVFVGLYIIFKFEFDHALGLIMAILSAMLAALFTIVNGQFTRTADAYTITYYEMVGATAGTALFLPLYTELFNKPLQLIPTWMDSFYLFILAVVCTVYAYSLSVKIMQKISPFMLNLTNNLEPVYGILLALLFFGEEEQMTTAFYIGTSVILFSVLSYPYLDRKVAKYQKRKTLARAPESL